MYITITYYHYNNKCQNRHWYDNTAGSLLCCHISACSDTFIIVIKVTDFFIIIDTLSFYSHSDSFLTYTVTMFMVILSELKLFLLFY